DGGLEGRKCSQLQATRRPRTEWRTIAGSDRRGLLGAAAVSGRAVLPLVLWTGLAGAAVLGLSVVVRVNVSSSAPIGLYRRLDRRVERGHLVVACIPPGVARLGRERGYLGPGSCPGDVQPVLKRIAALPGDFVEVGREAVTVNGTPVPYSDTATHDSRGRPLPHVPWGRIVVSPGEVWLLGSQTARSWDSRYFGPVPLDHVQAVHPVLTLESARETAPQGSPE